MRPALLIFFLGIALGRAEPITLVPLTHTWKYDQSGTNLGTAWAAPDYDDGAWPSGRGVFAYETITESVWRLTNTVLRIYGNDGPPLITYYFRTHFEVSTPVGGSLTMTFSNLIDDGAILYLNGQELYRLNMPLGTVDANTLANYAIPTPQEGIFVSTNISAIYLRPGDNVLAVEVHQANITSSDVHFGLSLGYDPSIIGDSITPEILSADMGLSLNELRVKFAARMDPNSANNPANYSIQSEDGDRLTVLSAVLTNFTDVILTTEPRRNGPRYTLTTQRLAAEGGSLTSVVRKRTIGYLMEWDTLGSFEGAPFLVWKYDQSGRQAPQGWNECGFDDAAWPSGPAGLGFEDNQAMQGYLRTMLTRLVDPCCSTQIVTYYFRSIVTNTGAARSVDFGGFVDDGAVFYWNGAEIRRLRMPAGAIGYGTFATQSVEMAFDRFIVPLTNAVPGPNVIAVEVHQPGAINNDIFFGMWVTGIVPSERVLPTLRYRRSGTQLAVDWDEMDFYLEIAPTVSGPWTRQLPVPHPVTLDMTGTRRFLRLTADR